MFGRIEKPTTPWPTEKPDCTFHPGRGVEIQLTEEAKNALLTGDAPFITERLGDGKCKWTYNSIQQDPAQRKMFFRFNGRAVAYLEWPVDYSPKYDVLTVDCLDGTADLSIT